jgi:hypothetical protein
MRFPPARAYRLNRFLERPQRDQWPGRGHERPPDRVCHSLRDNGQPDLVRQIIAKRIIEVARKGERDPDELCARALQALGFRIRQIA